MRRWSLLAAGWALFGCLPASAAKPVTGIVKDASGAVVRNAEVEVRDEGGTILAVRLTDEAGRFEWTAVPPAPPRIQLRVSAGGHATAEIMVQVEGDADPVEVSLQPRSIFTRVVVNATRGIAEPYSTSPHVAAVRDHDEIYRRPLPTIGHLFDQEPGIHLQQSTAGQVSPFLRGLTGYHVVNLVDGIRINNSTFRSGPNQYLAWVDPMQVHRAETMLGPAGSQYGSDSLGGTFQITTPEPRFPEPGEPRIHGELALGGATADLSGTSAAKLSAATRSVFWLAGISGRKHGDLRAGGGFDSRNVFHRLFGLSPAQVRALIGVRQQDSGYRQYGAQTKFALRFAEHQSISVHYLRGRQDRVRGYKDLLGGLGRLLSDFDPQDLDWFHARYERMQAGAFDSLSASFSLNSQADGSARQNLLHTDPITRDRGRVSVFGYMGQGTTHLGRRTIASFGGEVYDERIGSEREVLNPVTGTAGRQRPLYPDGSRYTNLGLFVQTGHDLARSLRAAGGARLTAVRFGTVSDPRFGIPESAQTFRDLTFHSSLRWQPTDLLGLHGVVSRGFRAPNLNDLGALGLNDLGYEVPAAETITAGALLAADAGEGAVSKGRPVRALSAESMMNYELGVSVTTRRMSARAQVFDAELRDPIVRRTLLFPARSLPSTLGGLPVTALEPTAAQKAQDVRAVATGLDPRAVKAFVNDGRARYYGLEALARYLAGTRWTVEGHYAYIRGRELDPDRPVRRLPPQRAAVSFRYFPPAGRRWFEFSLALAGRQGLLSGGDRDDERIGGSFRRRDIADFFDGSRVAAYRDGNRFAPTGETLRNIQDRVLPIGTVVRGVLVADDNSRVPLHLSTAGWAVLNLRAGLRLGERWQLMGAVENLLDHNYRSHGSGVDAPGTSIFLMLRWRF